jgi:hypothetical protein
MNEHLVQGSGKDGVPPLRSMLIALGGLRRGVTEAGHQLPDGGPLLGGQGPRRMAEVVQVDTGCLGRSSGPVPLLVEGGSP